MSPVDGHDVWLFSYGTLRQRAVQLAIFGRSLEGREDVLRAYTVSPLLITDPGVIATSGTAHHTIAHETGDPRDEVPGMLFTITQAELAAADAYEVADCKRVTVRLGSGIDAFVYAGRDVPPRGLGGRFSGTHHLRAPADAPARGLRGMAQCRLS